MTIQKLLTLFQCSWTDFAQEVEKASGSILILQRKKVGIGTAKKGGPAKSQVG